MKLVLKMLFLALALTSVVTYSFYLMGARYQDDMLNKVSSDDIKHASDTFLHLEEQDIKMLSSALEVVIQDPGFKSVYLEKDREKLYNYGQPLFQKLKSNSGITHFYFILPDGHVFLRLHGKDMHDDLVTRVTFQKARDTGGVSSGLELGKTAFALRVVAPYYNNSELVGYVELGEEIEHFLKILKGDTNNEFAIIVDKKYLKRDDWASVRQVAGLRDNWNDSEEHLLIASTSEGEIEAKCFTDETMERIENETFRFPQIRDRDRTFICGGFAIADASGRHTGAILSLVDITDEVSAAKKSNDALLSMTLILFFLSIAASLFVTRYVSVPITKLRDAAGEVAKGNLDARIEAAPGDELSELASAFNKMVGDLKESNKKIESHHRELESQVAQRTKELNEKVKELSDIKNAVLNMMEDTDELNRSLASAQEKLKANVEELKKLDSEKDKFISIAAHELKTPMTAIHGFAQLLEGEPNAESRIKYLKIIESEIDRLTLMITQVLDLSRIDVGALKLAIEDIDVPPIANEVAESLSPKIKEKNLTLDIRMGPKLPKIQTDKEKLKEILINLIGNAMKYTEKGGITVEASKEGEYVKFSVADTGIGISKEHFDKIFTRFYSVDSPLTRKAGSSGLGLSICKEFVEALGGKIWFESTVGKGTTFYFTLPIKNHANKPKAS